MKHMSLQNPADTTASANVATGTKQDLTREQVIKSFFTKLQSMDEDDLNEEDEDSSNAFPQISTRKEKAIDSLIDLKNPKVAVYFCDCILNCIKDQSHPEARIALFYSSTLLLFALQHYFLVWKEGRQPSSSSDHSIPSISTVLVKLSYVLRELTSINSFHQIKIGQKKYGNLFLSILNAVYQRHLPLTILLCEIIRNIVIKDSNKISYGEIGCCEIFMKLLQFYLQESSLYRKHHNNTNIHTDENNNHEGNDSVLLIGNEEVVISGIDPSTKPENEDEDLETLPSPVPISAEAANVPSGTSLDTEKIDAALKAEEEQEQGEETKKKETPQKKTTTPTSANNNETTTSPPPPVPTPPAGVATTPTGPPLPTPVDAILILCSSILNISANNSENKKKLGELGCCETLIEILVLSGFTATSDNNPKVNHNNTTGKPSLESNPSLVAMSLIKIVCGTIQNLSVDDGNKKRFGEIGCCEALIYVLLIFMENPVITWEVFSAIRNVSLNNDFNMKLFGLLGTLELLTKTLIMHVNNPEVVKQICGALRRLAFYHRVAKTSPVMDEQGYVRSRYTLPQLLTFVWNKKFSLYNRYKRLYNEEVLCETLLDAVSKYLEKIQSFKDKSFQQLSTVPFETSNKNSKPSVINTSNSQGNANTNAFLYYLSTNASSAQSSSPSFSEHNTLRELFCTIKCLSFNEDYYPFFDLHVCLPLIYQSLQLFHKNVELMKEICGAITGLSRMKEKKLLFLSYRYKKPSSRALVISSPSKTNETTLGNDNENLFTASSDKSSSLAPTLCELLVAIIEEQLQLLIKANAASNSRGASYDEYDGVENDNNKNENPSIHLEIIKEICRVVKAFAILEEGKAAFLTSNLSNLLIDCLEQALTYPDVILLIAGAILNLTANSKENKIKFGSEKCLNIIVHILLYYLSNQEIIKCLCGVIKNIAVYQNNKLLFAELNGCQVLFACLTTYYSQANPYSSSSTPSSQKITGPVVLASTLSGSKDHNEKDSSSAVLPDEHKLVLEILEAIWNVSLLPENKIVVGSIGGCEILIDLLQFYYKNPLLYKEIIKTLTGILKTLSLESSNHDHIGSHSGCQIIIKLLSKFYNNAEILKNMLFILYQIVTPNTNTSKQAISTAAGIVNSSSNKMNLSSPTSPVFNQVSVSSDPNSSVPATPSTAATPEEENKKLFGELDGCEKLILLFLNKNLIYADLDILKLLCKVIQQLTYNNSFNRSKFLANGCCEILMETLKRLPKIKFIKKVAAKSEDSTTSNTEPHLFTTNSQKKKGELSLVEGQLTKSQPKVVMVLGSESTDFIPQSPANAVLSLLEDADEQGIRSAQQLQQRIQYNLQENQLVMHQQKALKSFFNSPSFNDDDEDDDGEEEDEGEGNEEEENNEEGKEGGVGPPPVSSELDEDSKIMKDSNQLALTTSFKPTKQEIILGAMSSSIDNIGSNSQDGGAITNNNNPLITTTSSATKIESKSLQKKNSWSAMLSSSTTTGDEILEYLSEEDKLLYQKNKEIKKCIKLLVEKLSSDSQFKKRFEEIGIKKYLADYVLPRTNSSSSFLGFGRGGKDKGRPVSSIDGNDSEAGEGQQESQEEEGRRSVTESIPAAVNSIVEDYQKRQKFSDQRFENLTIML
jgi:hypothetical protein